MNGFIGKNVNLYSALFIQDTACIDHDRIYYMQSLYHNIGYNNIMNGKTIISIHPYKNTFYKDNIIWSF